MFIVLSRISAQRANLQQTPYLVAAAPVFASVMLGHAIVARLKELGYPELRDLGVGIVHHGANPHIEYLPNTNGWSGSYPCQFRGATGEIASGGKGPTQNSMQPAVTGDIDISLLLKLNAGIDLNEVRRVIQGMRIRLAGGVVPRVPKVLEADDLNEAIRKCGRGFWVSDATPLVQERLASGKSVIEAVMGRQLFGWHVPATLGYRALSRFAQRTGARDGLDHAYGEALVGLVRYDSLFSVLRQGEPTPQLWSHGWINPSSFIVYQGEMK
ncbi:MAG: hypothetical protein HYZ17_06185 [Betaproteobacteria bacterium]|nr:hypothetical protein [Betaproteobacteria bacterium]